MSSEVALDLASKILEGTTTLTDPASLLMSTAVGRKELAQKMGVQASDTGTPRDEARIVTGQQAASNKRRVRLALTYKSKEPPDDLLLNCVAQGDNEALSLLFRRYANAVFSVACRILRDDSEAEDLLQELFLFVFKKAALFDAEKSSGGSWIIQMAYQRAIDRRRYLDVRHHYCVQELNEERSPAGRSQISIDQITGRALLDRLRTEISAEQRHALELHLFEGYSFREIAARSGQTLGNIRNHYYRGIERLRSYVFRK